MPILTTFQLSFVSGLHLGTRGVNLEEHGVHLSSDTLFSALVDTWRRLGGDPEAFVQPFLARTPPFLLSSAFPIAGKVRFYPTPVDLSHLLGPGADQSHGKSIKRILYLSEGLWRRVLAGEKLDNWLYPADEYEPPKTGVALQGGALWLSLAEVASLPQGFRMLSENSANDRPRPVFALRRLSVWSSQRVPRVTVDRISSASTIYHSGRTSFAQDCGLWFGIAWLDPAAVVSGDGRSYRDAVTLTLHTLQADGLGGERSVGYGAFSCAEGDPVTLPDPGLGEPAWLLSRYHPRGDELPTALADPRSAYRLTAVAGWLRTPDGAAQRRKRLQMVAEGSIVCPPTYPAGDVVDVRPTYENPLGDVPHAVYRYGLALGVSVAKAGANHG